MISPARSTVYFFRKSSQSTAGVGAYRLKKFNSMQQPIHLLSLKDIQRLPVYSQA
jgi:hypothetical protein